MEIVLIIVAFVGASLKASLCGNEVMTSNRLVEKPLSYAAQPADRIENPIVRSPNPDEGV